MINRSRVVAIDVLHLFVLAGFAVAQPLYDLLGRTPEFFVAHHAGFGRILSLVAVVSLGVALGLVLIELIAGIFGERVRRRVHWGLIFCLAVLIALPIVKGWMRGSDFLIVGLALVMGVAFLVLYAHWPVIRLFVTVLSPAVIAFPLWFLVWTPVNRLVLPETVEAQADIAIDNPVPVVVVVLDELNLTALVDATGQIDRVRFPHFAALAADSWWFPNAVAASELTERAVPAILTGRNAKTEVRHTPTATDHPKNLFTMLGEQYRLNVWESVTTLCPDVLCPKQNDEDRSPSFPAFVADIAIIYLHIITPPFSRQQLPTLDSRWSGFGGVLIGHTTFRNKEGHSPGGRPARGTENRDAHLAYFLSQIEASSVPVLHFLHVLLPHVNYEYLVSGHRYASDRQPFPEGFIEGKEWIGEEPLIVTAYHRNLQQIGYLDRFLGQLRQRLKASRMYDSALIMVTADHGVAFQRGLARRAVENGNESDILKIPMIVKLPGQREGRISERVVNGIDVLPTIADVLGVRVPWDMDGHSMFSDEKPARREIMIPGVGRFNVKMFEGFPRLEWQIQHFGDRSTLEGLVPKGPYPGLIGRHITEVAVGQSSGLQFQSENITDFEHVYSASGFLPALFKAHMVAADENNFPIAIALNGQIWATTNTSEWDGEHNYFSVLLPPAAFKEGRNEIGVYRIEEPGGSLRPVDWVGKSLMVKLHHDRHSQLTLVFPDRREISVKEDPDVMQGHLDSVLVIGNMLVFAGWGVDVVEKRPASEVLVFAGEQLVSRVKPESSRPDISEKFEQQEVLHSGFHATVPVESFSHPGAPIRVVLLSSSDRALALSLQDEQHGVIRAALEKPFSAKDAEN